MKKIVMTLAIAGLALSFAACGGKKADSNQTDTITTETLTEHSSDIVAKYQELCDKMVELSKKVKEGDTAATEEYTKIAQEFGQYAQDHADEWAKMSENDLQKVKEIAQKAAEEMSK